jgi:hypothetical protein
MYRIERERERATRCWFSSIDKEIIFFSLKKKMNIRRKEIRML